MPKKGWAVTALPTCPHSTVLKYVFKILHHSSPSTSHVALAFHLVSRFTNRRCIFDMIHVAILQRVLKLRSQFPPRHLSLSYTVVYRLATKCTRAAYLYLLFVLLTGSDNGVTSSPLALLNLPHPLHYTLFYPVAAHIAEGVWISHERKEDLDSLTFRKQMVLVVWKTFASSNLKTFKLVVNETVLRI
jgi:hypothetical protein